MTARLEIDTADIDNNNQVVASEIAEALRKSGLFYRDSDGGWLASSIAPDGKSFITERLNPPVTLSQVAKRRGLITWMRRHRNRLVPHILAYQAQYDRWLDQLPLTDPGLFLNWKKADGIYRLPAMVIDQGKLIEAWGGGHHDRLFCGETLPAQTMPDYSHLIEWFSAMEFTDARYKANLYGWVLAALARPACDQFPFLVVDGRERKVGKTTVADAICYFLTGDSGSPITHTGDETEFEKRVAGSCGKPGPNVIYIDNVRPKRGASRSIRSQLLATAATCPCPSVRPVYGKKPVRLDYPIVIFTMNEGSVENDLHDRALRVVLGGQAGRYFKPNPLDYVKEHRQTLLLEARQLLSSVRVDGEFEHVTRLGTWERIATKAAAALGMRTDYNPDAGDTSDAFVKELDATITALMSENGGRPITLTDVAARVTQFSQFLPELTELLRRNPCVSATQQGHAIRKELERLAQRSLEIDGARVTFNLQKNSSNQYVVSIEKAPI